MRVAARTGLLARAVVYVVLGWLAIDIATGHRQHQANQKGALADVASHPGGTALLIVVVAGLWCYAAWQLSRAVFGTAEGGKDASPRLQSLFGAIFYSALAVTGIEVLAGSSGSGQSQQQAGWTAQTMHHTGGRWLVGIAGAVFVVVGAFMAWQGVTRQFRDQLDTSRLSKLQQRIIDTLGTYGGTARGLVTALAGALVIDAAVTADPHKSTGLDGALRSLAEQPLGLWLLGITAAGLITFGLFSAACAGWQKV